MKSLLITITLGCFVLSSAFGQRNPVDIHLFRYLKSAQPYEALDLLVKGNVSGVEDMVLESEGVFKYAYGDISAIRLQVSKIDDLATLKGIEKISLPVGRASILNDKVRINNNVDSVHNGWGGLSRKYKGKGVIVGVLDTGIDFLHPDFMHPDSSTRILHIWDQNHPNAPNTPPQYGYGQEWDSSAINSGNCIHEDFQSHGTRVSGVAAGNGMTDSTYTGVAPEADIIFVAIGFNNNFMTNVLDGADYIFRKADALGMPCVINASLGSYLGSHDGQDLVAQLIDNMVKAKNGRSFVCAAGNGGDKFFHLGYNVNADTNFTWFGYNNNIGMAYLQLWADTADFNQVDFQIGVENQNSGYRKVDETRFYNLLTDFNLGSGPGKVTDTLKNSNGQRIATVDIYADIEGDSYVVEYIVIPDTTNYLWRLSLTGNGYFDIWSDKVLMGTSNFKKINLPDSTVYPNIGMIKLPDNKRSLVTSWACSPEVISVGAYYNRDSFTTWNNKTVKYTEPSGSFGEFSSYGPTRKGLLKPEITASGARALAPTTLAKIAFFKSSSPLELSESGWHSILTGTSSASPIVAGAVALYLERYPNASHTEIIKAITAMAVQDNFTGFSLPDNQWGYGKLDVYKMLNVQKGCTDPLAINYDPGAIIDNDSCEYDPIGINPLEKANYLDVIPNPSDGNTIIKLSLELTDVTDWYIDIYNSSGIMVRQIKVNNKFSKYALNGQDLPSGIYLIGLRDENQYITSEKIVIY